MKIKVIEVGMLHTNCTLVMDEQSKKAVLFDPGAQSEKILRMIQDEGAEVELIVLTHGHFDHVLAVPAVKNATGARLMMHKADEYRLDEKAAFHPGYINETYVRPDVDMYMEDGSEFSVGGMSFKVINTPGHTWGSCVIICDNFMIAGDTLFQGSCGRCDLEGGDMEEMLKSLKRLAGVEGDKNVICGHGGATTLDTERFGNPYMRQALKR